MQNPMQYESEFRGVSGVILAAGASRRMGRDKATIEMRGRSFLEHCAYGMAPFCRRLVIVLGFNAETIEAAVRPRLEAAAFADRLEWARNLAPERGQFSSLQTGFEALGCHGEAVVVCPVDHPLFQPATIAALLAAWRCATPPAQIIKPAYQGQHGHPVLYGAEAVRAMLAAGVSSTARAVQEAYAHATRIVPVEDPGILRNLDTPEELRKGKEE